MKVICHICYMIFENFSINTFLMKFTGQRKSKHYFPTHASDPLVNLIQQTPKLHRPTIVGVSQTIVDIEARVDDEFLTRYDPVKAIHWYWKRVKRMLSIMNWSSVDCPLTSIREIRLATHCTTIRF